MEVYQRQAVNWEYWGLSPTTDILKLGQLCSNHFACVVQKRNQKPSGPFYLVYILLWKESTLIKIPFDR